MTGIAALCAAVLILTVVLVLALRRDLQRAHIRRLVRLAIRRETAAAFASISFKTRAVGRPAVTEALLRSARETDAWFEAADRARQA